MASMDERLAALDRAGRRNRRLRKRARRLGITKPKSPNLPGAQEATRARKGARKAGPRRPKPRPSGTGAEHAARTPAPHVRRAAARARRRGFIVRGSKDAEVLGQYQRDLKAASRNTLDVLGEGIISRNTTRRVLRDPGFATRLLLTRFHDRPGAAKARRIPLVFNYSGAADLIPAVAASGARRRAMRRGLAEPTNDIVTAATLLTPGGIPKMLGGKGATLIGARLAAGTARTTIRAAIAAGRIGPKNVNRLRRLALAAKKTRRLARQRAAQRRYITPAAARRLTPTTATRARAAFGAQTGGAKARTLVLGSAGVATASTPGGRRLATAPALLATDFVLNPSGTLAVTTKTTQAMLAGLPVGIIYATQHPIKAAEMMKDDIIRRWGPLYRGDSAKFRQIAREEGLTPYFLDLLMFSPVSQIAGRAGRAGILGPEFQKWMTRKRPDLRLGGGEGGAVTQEIGRGVGSVTRQRLLDTLRARRNARQVRHGEGRLVQPRAGEVVPLSRWAHNRMIRRHEATTLGRFGIAAGTLSREQSRALAEAVKGLSPLQRRALRLVVILGLPADPEKAAARLVLRQKDVVAARKAEGMAAPRKADEVALIDELLANKYQVFTPELRNAGNVIRDLGREAAALDPTLVPEQIAARTEGPQAEHLSRELAAQSAQAPTDLRIEELFHTDTAGRFTDPLARKIAAAHDALNPEARAALAHWLTAPGDVTPRIRAMLDEQFAPIREELRARYGDTVRLYRGQTLNVDGAGARDYLSYTTDRDLAMMYSDKGNTAAPVHEARAKALEAEGRTEDAAAARAQAENARNSRGFVHEADVPVDRILAINAPKDVVYNEFFVRVTPDEARALIEGNTSRDLIGGPRGRTAAAEGASLPGLKYSGPLTAERLAAARKAAGLEEPGYFPSQLRPSFKRPGRSRGLGLDNPREYTGVLYRLGIEDDNLAVLANALASNVRRKFSWERVVSSVERAALPYGRGQSVTQIWRALDEAGVQGDDVVLVNMGALRRGRIDDALLPSEAINDALKPLAQYSKKSTAQGFVAVPRQVTEELMRVAGEGGHIAKASTFLKSKASRVILGSANVPWLQFQILSNIALTGMAGVGPMSVVRAARWWKKLSEEQRRDIAPYLGQGHFDQDAFSPTFFKTENNRLINAYRAFKATHPRLGRANPLNWMFAADRAQNLFFRRTVLYNRLHREAYGRLGRSHSKLMDAQGSAVAALKGDLKNGVPAMERAAKAVDEYLGDYLSFTTNERRVFANNTMFYGFMRFSLRFTFYTMPTKHPTTTAILGKLALLDPQEMRELLGAGWMPYMLGKFYTDKDGRLAIDLSRANPALSALVSGASPLQTLAGILPPHVSHILYTQIAALDAFRGKQIKIQGKSRRVAPLDRIGAVDRGRIALRTTLNLFYPARVTEKLLAGGQPLGADHLFFSPRPTKYKDEKIVRSINKSRAETKRRGLGKNFVSEVLPFLPELSIDEQIAKSRTRDLEAAEGKTKPKKRRRLAPSGSSFGGSAGGSAGGGAFGGSSGGGSAF